MKPHFTKPTEIALSAERLKTAYHKETKTFAFELSELSDDSMTNGDLRSVILKNLNNGNSIEFGFTHRDMDATDEDTYGYNYQSDNGIKLLLIND